MTQRRVLVVDDEPTIAASVATRLRAEGFAVDIAHDGPSAVASARADPPDLVVLDVMLPGGRPRGVPAHPGRPPGPGPHAHRARRRDRPAGGAGRGRRRLHDEAVLARELAARVHALFRRIDRMTEAGPACTPLRVGDLEIDPAQRRVSRGGEPAHLTPIEFDLLAHLASRPRDVHAREVLLEQVWGWAAGTTTRTVDSHVKASRRKLGADLIRTVHGVGYALEVRG